MIRVYKASRSYLYKSVLLYWLNGVQVSYYDYKNVSANFFIKVLRKLCFIIHDYS